MSVDLAPVLDATVAAVAPLVATLVGGWVAALVARVTGRMIEARDRADLEAAVERSLDWAAANARERASLRVTTGRAEVDLALDYLAQGAARVIRRLGGQIDDETASEDVVRRVEAAAARRRKGG